MDEKLALLAKVPLLAGLSDKELQAVGRLADEVDVPAGKVLAKQGDSAEEFFVIIEGSVSVERNGQHLRDMHAGNFFGELAMLARLARTATVTTTAPTRLLVVGHREFTSLLSSMPTVQDRVLHAVAHLITTLEPDRTT
ncbi:MAG TPA: cyclic nucleotide-binding domain-containing protein [Candidatus Limnocylindrales bacterium]|jgi:CRP-like cAMP-binding protein|nr:cyclic nucleotide-binding domain-containing protein [Candidatus Limnocylindrales bacterium]